MLYWFILYYDARSINRVVADVLRHAKSRLKSGRLDWQFNLPQLEHRAGHAHSCHMLPRISCWIGKTSFSLCLFDTQDAMHLHDIITQDRHVDDTANIWDLVSCAILWHLVTLWWPASSCLLKWLLTSSACFWTLRCMEATSGKGFGPGMPEKKRKHRAETELKWWQEKLHGLKQRQET